MGGGGGGGGGGELLWWALIRRANVSFQPFIQIISQHLAMVRIN